MKDMKHVGEKEPEEHFAYSFVTFLAMACCCIGFYVIGSILMALEYV